ncbi:MAG: hypothetical protein HW400_291, partial [Candidatus Levybacteria bacterium]|nr:hypothetical protein [Candidatus Levybacteria bacterium]
INAGCVASYPNNFGVSTPASPASCTTTITFMSAVNDPNGVAYDFEATASCAMTTAAPCTAVSVMGTAFAEGTTVTGVWCWRSATGAITNMAAANYAAGDLLCNP